MPSAGCTLTGARQPALWHQQPAALLGSKLGGHPNNQHVCVQYSREEQAQQAQQAAQRQGITIGGAGGHTSQFRLRDRSPGLAAATQASLDTARAEAASQVRLRRDP